MRRVRRGMKRVDGRTPLVEEAVVDYIKCENKPLKNRPFDHLE